LLDRTCRVSDSRLPHAGHSSHILRGLSGDAASFSMVLHFEQKNWMFCPEVVMLASSPYRL
jgi:hypothetical protein